MIALECDDSDLERSLRKFEDQVGAAGGWLSDGLTVVSEAGGIMVETRSDSAGSECMMSIPEEVLLPADLVQWRLVGDDLCIDSFAKDMPQERRELFETNVEIFNLTNKISTHRNRSPGIALRDDLDLLDYLLNARNRTFQLDEDVSDQSVIRSFLNSRVFAFSYGNRCGDVLMPFIDFLNHHPDATGYQPESEKHPGQAVIAALDSRPTAASRECFVRYGMFDAYDLLSVYAYVDRCCPFVRSVPMTIELEGLGDIEVHSVDALQLRNSKASRWDQGAHELSHLFIPGPQEPHAMRRALAQAIDLVRPGLGQNEQASFVREAEGQVISANAAYYEGLRERVQESPVQGAYRQEIYALLEELAAIQLSRLADYLSMGESSYSGCPPHLQDS